MSSLTPYKICSDKWYHEVQSLIRNYKEDRDIPGPEEGSQIDQFVNRLSRACDAREDGEFLDDQGEPWIQRGPVALERLEWLLVGLQSGRENNEERRFYESLLRRVRDIKRMRQARAAIDWRFETAAWASREFGVTFTRADTLVCMLEEGRSRNKIAEHVNGISPYQADIAREKLISFDVIG